MDSTTEGERGGKDVTDLAIRVENLRKLYRIGQLVGETEKGKVGESGNGRMGEREHGC
jgi:hypothetical protein